MTREFLEILEPFGEETRHERDIDLEIAMHEHVTETGDGAEPRRETGRQRARLGEALDGGPVVVRRAAGRRFDMAGDVEGVLRA